MLSRSAFRTLPPLGPPRKHVDAVETHAFAGLGRSIVSEPARESMAPSREPCAASRSPIDCVAPMIIGRSRFPISEQARTPMTAPQRRRNEASPASPRMTKAERKRQLLKHAKQLFVQFGYRE